MATTTASPTDRWNGPEGRLWAQEADRFDRMTAPLLTALMDAAALTPGERVLDVGSGAGATTRAAASAVGPRGGVTGIDPSTPLVALARERGSDVIVGDAQTYPLPAHAFDAVISRNGLMLFEDPPAAFANLHRALKPGGRLAFVTWAEGAANGWSTIPNAALRAHLPLPEPAEGGPCAFSLSVPARLHGVLGRAGFEDVQLTRLDQPLWVASDVSDALAFFEQSAGDLREHVPKEIVNRILVTLRASLATYVEPDGVYLPAAAWVITIRRPAACTD